MLAHTQSQRTCSGDKHRELVVSIWTGWPRLGGNVSWGNEMGRHVHGIARAAREEQRQRRQCEGIVEASSASMGRWIERRSRPHIGQAMHLQPRHGLVASHASVARMQQQDQATADQDRPPRDQGTTRHRPSTRAGQ
jgi:hypothetical protein